MCSWIGICRTRLMLLAAQGMWAMIACVSTTECLSHLNNFYS